MRGNEEGTGHGNCQKGNEPNIKMGVNPTEQEDDHEGQLKDRTPGVGEEMKGEFVGHLGLHVSGTQKHKHMK